ncbi:MAG: pyrrolo-quinoline quinone, partial [Alphaproteobacteria bacterium]
SGSGREKETPLSGQRISVLSFEQNLSADPQVGNIRISLPQPYRNFDWPQSGGSPTKALHHLAVGERLRPLWRASIGRGSSSTTRLVNPPVVAEGVLYAVDTQATVSALNANSGDVIWRQQIRVKKEKKGIAFGGGVAVGDGRLFVTTGYGVIAALDAVSGREIWRNNIVIPFRGPPGYGDGRVFAVTQDNQLFAFSADDGVILWDHVGIAESAGIMGTAAPAIAGDTVVAAFSSGEVVAFRAENGRIAWADTLSRSGRVTALAALSDVDGDPVIDRGTVYAISHAGRMAAIDFATGNRIWENNLGGIATPWVAGDFIYVVTADSEVVCLLRRDGRIRWVRQLQRFKDPKDR